MLRPGCTSLLEVLRICLFSGVEVVVVTPARMLTSSPSCLYIVLLHEEQALVRKTLGVPVDVVSWFALGYVHTAG